MSVSLGLFWAVAGKSHQRCPSLQWPQGPSSESSFWGKSVQAQEAMAGGGGVAGTAEPALPYCCLSIPQVTCAPGRQGLTRPGGGRVHEERLLLTPCPHKGTESTSHWQLVTSQDNCAQGDEHRPLRLFSQRHLCTVRVQLGDRPMKLPGLGTGHESHQKADTNLGSL